MLDRQVTCHSKSSHLLDFHMLHDCPSCFVTSFRRIVLLLIICVGAGCTSRREWVAAPAISVQQGAGIFDATPRQNRTPHIEVIYVTDRIGVDDDGALRYGHQRSDVISFGIASVAFEPQMTWKQLIAESVNPKRSRPYYLSVNEIKKSGGFKSYPDRLVVADDRYELPSEAARAVDEENAELAALIDERLKWTKDKDVYLSVHGLENSFDDAIFRTAEVWHYGGRNGVAVAYTWPSGYGGLLGYVYDRESAEFTISHFKRVLRIIASCGQAQRVHIITHSRGAEVAMTALRELHIEAQAKGLDTGKQLKLETLVMAAPDIDWQVFQQRVKGEMLMNVPRRTVVYFSESDDALGFAQWLFNSVGRLGSMKVKHDVGSPDVAQFAGYERIEFINCDVAGFHATHNYVFAHPAVLSDLIITVRDRLPAGTPTGRPLEMPVRGVWQITNDYLSTDPVKRQTDR